MTQAILDFCRSTPWLQAVMLWSDFLIFASYFAIPLAIVHVYRVRRQDIPFSPLWLLFALFIFSCGTTHLVHAVGQFVRLETAETTLRVVTAAASVGSTIALFLEVPRIKLIPTPEQYRRLNDQLEVRVAERTRELTGALERERALQLEIGHRVGNIAQVALAALALQDRPDVDGPALGAEARVRIEALADLSDLTSPAELTA